MPGAVHGPPRDPAHGFSCCLLFCYFAATLWGEDRAHCYFSELCFQGKPWFVGLLPKDLIRMAAGNIALQRGT
jgi:hypothetical protein